MDTPVTVTGGQQKMLLPEELTVGRFFGRIQVDVPAGYQCLVYRNGRLYKTFDEGRHTWQDFGLFVKYTAQKVDAREHSIGPIVARGQLRDLVNNTVVTVEVPLTITYRLRDIKTFRETVNPLDKLIRLAPNYIATLLAQLRYDPNQPWHITLRNELERYLMVTAVQQTGLLVTGVLIADVQKDTAVINRILLGRVIAGERRSGQVADAAAQDMAMVNHAGAVAKAAEAVGANAADVYITELDNGKDLLDQYGRLRAIEGATGERLGTTSISPSSPQGLPPGSYAGPNSQSNQYTTTPGSSGYGYSGPNSQYTTTPPFGQPGPNSQYGAPSQPSPRATPPFPSAPSAPSQPGGAPSYGAPAISSVPLPNQISQQRLDSEQQRLEAGDYTVTIEPQQSPVKVTAHRATSGTQPLTIVFYLDADYPLRPPSKIWVNTPQNSWQAYSTALAAQWTQANWLRQIADEIAPPLGI